MRDFQPLMAVPRIWSIGEEAIAMARASETRATMTSPSVARNRDPVLTILQRVLPKNGVVLEIASGTGEHALFFAAALPQLTWQPTDQDEQALKSIAAEAP